MQLSPRECLIELDARSIEMAKSLIEICSQHVEAEIETRQRSAQFRRNLFERAAQQRTIVVFSAGSEITVKVQNERVGRISKSGGCLSARRVLILNPALQIRLQFVH